VSGNRNRGKQALCPQPFLRRRFDDRHILVAGVTVMLEQQALQIPNGLDVAFVDGVEVAQFVAFDNDR